MMKRFNHVFLLILMALTVFNACEKDELKETANAESNELFKGVSKDMLYFEDYDSFQKELEYVSNLTSEDLKKWEDAKGFKSIASFCEDVTFSVDPDNFETEEQFVKFLTKNAAYLKIETDENGEENIEPMYFDHRARYFLNINQMYQIGNVVYKEFESGTLTCPQMYEDLLKDVVNPELYENEPGFKFVRASNPKLKSKWSVCSTLFFGGKGNRFKISMTLDRMPFDENGSMAAWWFVLQPRKKTWGRWYGCSRTMDARLNAKVAYKFNNEIKIEIIKFSDNNVTSRYWEQNVHRTKIDKITDFYPEFVSFDFWAKFPGTSDQIFQCNN